MNGGTRHRFIKRCSDRLRANDNQDDNGGAIG